MNEKSIRSAVAHSQAAGRRSRLQSVYIPKVMNAIFDEILGDLAPKRETRTRESRKYNVQQRHGRKGK